MLRLAFILGWLPALVAAALTGTGIGSNRVLTPPAVTNVWPALGLATSLGLLCGAYVAAIRRPPNPRTLVAASLGSLLVALALPVLFSADVYAYAYYGDLALHGRNPWSHAGPPAGDPLATAAVAAWDGHVPPRCVYGPVAVAIAALADRAGAFGGVSGQIVAARLTAAGAYVAYLIFALRLVRDPRARAVLLLNPAVIWSVAEGHNDAAMVALVFAGLGARRPLLVAVGALVKAPALLVLAHFRRSRAAAAGLALVSAGYVPFAVALLGAQAAPAAGPPAAWVSPLGLLAGFTGRVSAVAVALVVLGSVALAARRLPAVDRTTALAIAAWFALPNAYPWYAVWIVPLAARRVGSIWSLTLLAASVSAPVRAIGDAVFEASSTFDAARTFKSGMIALEYLPPLCVLAAAALRRRGATVAVVSVAMLALGGAPAGAQGVAQPPSPEPAPSASFRPPEPSPQPALPPAPPTPASTVSPTAPAGPPTPAPPLQPPTAVPSAAGTPTPAPIPSPTPNPFTYVITPVPVPVTTPDGPHIIEVLVNDRQIHAGGPLIVRVLTSPNVVGVEARTMGRFIPIPANSPGMFSLAYTMPGGIPFWLLNRNYEIVIAAATADGRQVTVSFSMLLTH